jgi:ubiquinone/menaquinone biosynthesis C-methylase UbiE
MIDKIIQLNNVSALKCEAADLIFKDKSFDYVFAFGVFHYFPDHAYANKCIDEMKRIAKKGICISDLPEISHDPNHLLFDKKLFTGWRVTDSFYKNQFPRYTATLILDN